MTSRPILIDYSRAHGAALLHLEALNTLNTGYPFPGFLFSLVITRVLSYISDLNVI